MIRKILPIFVAIFMLLGLLYISPRSSAAQGKQAGQVSISSGYLNVRSQPSAASQAVARLYKGSFVTLHSRSGDWWRVEYASGRYGYCHADYIRVVSSKSAQVKISSGYLNVRSGPGTGYTKTASLSKNEEVLVLEESGQWSRVLLRGNQTGYVSRQYLSTGLGAVSLAVPSFKQNDSRWANITIGTSGKPFSKIGCATTAIAMMESYRTGTTIYPHIMAQSLRYTPGGDVYWPEDYQVVTSSADYLNAVYQKLKAGKPVLFGARNAYGSQHWVVITGFTGGELTASAFTVHDPGSSSRTNLQQFLSAYPTFYKFFYY